MERRIKVKNRPIHLIMKQLLLVGFLVCCSCIEQEKRTSIVLENDKIYPEIIKSLDESERALLAWYLYAYGNACEDNSTKFKCQILNELSIDDECNPKHLSNLLQWFTHDLLAPSKLNNCPSIPSNSSIQNTFSRIILIKHRDTLSIEYNIRGLNNSQEKSWNFDEVDRFIIKKNTFEKIEIK